MWYSGKDDFLALMPSFVQHFYSAPTGFLVEIICAINVADSLPVVITQFILNVS